MPPRCPVRGRTCSRRCGGRTGAAAPVVRGPWWIAAAAAVVLAFVAIAVPLSILRPFDATESVAFESVADVPLTATAELTPAGWGTRIELDCRYCRGRGHPTPPPRAGRTHSWWSTATASAARSSSWRASPGSTARLSAATAVDLDDIASLEIRALGSGDVLMRGVTE